MVRKVFVSVLGAGLYEKCKYVSGDFCSSETTFIQFATLEMLQHHSEWTSESKAYFLLTDKAKADNWEVKDGRRYDNKKGEYVPYVGLKQTLEEASLPFSYDVISIPDGKNESEMWEIFEKTYNLLEDGDELYFDLTHSFRYLPMLILVLGNYAKFLKKATVCSISYGNYEARDIIGNKAPIVDLLPLSSLQDWTFATADFLKNGYTDRLVELSEKGLNPLMRNAETRTEDTKRLKSFVNNLKIFALDMQTCRGLNVIDATTIEKIKSDMSDLQNVVIPQLKPVLRKVQKSIDPFNDSKEIANIKNANKNSKDELILSPEISKKFNEMINKLQVADNVIQSMSQRMNFLEKQLYDINSNKNTKKENDDNLANLNEAINYYNNVIKKNGNDNPVEIFEDVNNHVEDIRQEVLMNKEFK